MILISLVSNYIHVYIYIVYNWINQNDANYQQRRKRIIQIIYIYIVYLSFNGKAENYQILILLIQ